MLNLLDYKKIMIIGNNGSGKSYFAKKLSEITRMPLFHLDLEFWKPNWEHISENEWIEKQVSITSGREWIIDSKFLNINSEMINGFSINIERSRLLYFFPRSDQRYVSSFFKTASNEDLNIKALPPIVKNIKRTKIEKNKVVVYFSTYSNNSAYYKDILNLIKTYTEYKFYIYSDIEYPKYKKFNNLIFKKIGPEFDMDLSNCNFIISSSGHQLISEAINLGIPLYIFPLDTFDQNYCCKMVEKNSFGKAIKKCNKTEFNQFINNIDVYRNKMLDYKKTNWNTSWDLILFKDLERKFGIIKL